MKFGKFFVIAAVLCMAVGASAQTTVHSGAIYDWVISAPTAVGDGSENLCSVILSIVNKVPANAALNPQAYDSLLGGLGGIQGLSTNLHQHHGAAFRPFPATPTPTLGSSWADAIDTHFLIDLASPTIIVAPGGAPVEDYAAPSLEAAAPIGLTDFGNFLTGTFAIAGVASPTWQLAQIVVPSGTLVSVDADVAAGNGASERASFVMDPCFVIPTPAALPMGLLGLALIRRRR